MAVPGTVREQDAVLAAYRLLDAINERDADALDAVTTDDVELRTSDGREWRGQDGARALLDEAHRTKLRLIPLHRGEHAEDRGDGVWVELRVREITAEDDEPRIADLVARGDQVASMTLRPAPYEPGIA